VANLKIIIHTSGSEINSLTEEWEMLVDSIELSNPYHRPSWILSWWNNNQDADLRLTIVTARDGSGNLCGLLPLAADSKGRARFAACELSDVCSAVVSNSRRLEFWFLCIEALARNSSLKVLELDPLDDADCVSLLKVCGHRAKIFGADFGGRIYLPDSREGYLQKLSCARNRKIRYERRLIERLEGLTFQVNHSRDTLTSDLVQFWTRRENSWIERGRYNELAPRSRGGELLQFLISLSSFVREQTLSIGVASLTGDNSVIASALLLRSGSRTWYPLCTFEPSFSAYSPGKNLLLECINFCIDRGDTSLEMGRGLENYKFSYGAAKYSLSQVRVELS
jgi:CelD/BcsL family acetyltransferase involved in cellulose biosynthesis